MDGSNNCVRLWCFDLSQRILEANPDGNEGTISFQKVPRYVLSRGRFEILSLNIEPLLSEVIDAASEPETAKLIQSINRSQSAAGLKRRKNLCGLTCA